MVAPKTQLKVHTSEELKEFIARYVAALPQHIRVYKVILFGSYARRTPRRESDIDLAVISPDFNKNALADLYLLSQSRAAASWDIEVLPYSLQQYEHCETESFLHEILRTGVIVYDGSREDRQK